MLKLYNTLTRKKENFKPLKGNEVRMYVCGPTVNGVPHLGHARQQITFDILRRFLKFLGYKVKFVSNITDIDDKIINAANEKGIDIKEFAKNNMKEHMEDYAAIGIEKPDVQPKATEYVKEMIALVRLLEKRGFTYVLDDGVYFDISEFKNYGKLSHQNIEDLQAGKRIKVKDEKRNKEDFVLWKFSKPGEPSWKSPWGEGRPGWHIECSAMSQKILGLPLDIHGGGQDLIFPHHEDEIAQSEAAWGKEFAKFWVHNGMVNVEKVKMSKSLGNFKTIKDILKDYEGRVIRYFVLSAHYRKPVDFSKETLDNAKNAYERLKNLIGEMQDPKKPKISGASKRGSSYGDGKINEKVLREFEKKMSDDLDTANALAVLWKLVRDEKAEGKINTIKKIDEVLGLDLLRKENISAPPEIKKLVDEREKARKEKDWVKADKIRNGIKKKGYILEDSEGGVKVKKI